MNKVYFKRAWAWRNWLFERPVLVTLALALVVRLLIALEFANVIAIDEIYQYLEQAHRLVFGQGLVPWEYQVGMRNWLIPFLLAAPMEFGRWFFSDPLPGLILIRICLCVASLGIVWSAARLGLRFYGARGAWVAGLCAALWPDLWLMAPHSLEEVFAADCLVPALYLLELRHPNGDETRVAASGFLLGLAFVFRLQLAPAIAVAGIFLCGRNFFYWRVAVLGAAVPVFSAGLIDWFTWGEPFRSFWLNADLNLFHELAAREFGQDSAMFYFHAIALNWMWSFPFIGVLCWRGGQKLPVFGWTALVILATHTPLAHKEIRFIFPALALFGVLAGIGLADMLIARNFDKTSYWRKLAAVALLAGPFFSPLLAASLENGTTSFAIFESIKSETSGLIAANDYSEAYMPLDILFRHRALVEPMTVAEISRLRPGLILSSDPAFEAPGYHRSVCFTAKSIKYFPQQNSDICVWGNDVAHAGTPPAPMVNFYVPLQARSFEIVDRLFPDEPPSDLGSGM